MNEFQSAICKRKTGKERSEDLEEKKEIFVCIQVKYSWDILY